MSTNPAPTHFRFLDLPAELRNDVYKQVLFDDDDQPPLMEANSKIRKELAPLYWSQQELDLQLTAIPGDILPDMIEFPASAAQHVGMFKVSFYCKALFGDSYLRTNLIVSPVAELYFLTAKIIAYRRPNVLFDAIAIYEAWKSLYSLQAWMDEKFAGADIRPDDMNLPTLRLYHHPNQDPTEQYEQPEPDPLYFSILVCILAEAHILLLRLRDLWVTDDAYMPCTKDLLKLAIMLICGPWILLQIHHFGEYLWILLVVLPAIFRVGLQSFNVLIRLPILRATMLLWPTLFFLNLVGLFFYYGSWTTGPILLFFVSLLLTIA